MCQYEEFFLKKNLPKCEQGSVETLINNLFVKVCQGKSISTICMNNMCQIGQ